MSLLHRRPEVRTSRVRLPTIRGYAAVWGVVSNPLPGRSDRERIRPGALVLGMPGYPSVSCTIDHDSGRRVSRTADGTLVLTNDPIGLHVVLDPHGSPWGVEAMQVVREGYRWSFTFHDGVHEAGCREAVILVRELISARVVEVSLVRRAAYTQTVAVLA